VLRAVIYVGRWYYEVIANLGNEQRLATDSKEKLSLVSGGRFTLENSYPIDGETATCFHTT